ncbi:MAG TPA: cytochrome c oxidase assembly protein [Dehalococcoidia bacterium]|nr:cytochrome c oxidase assembly protein [Dehalococcoidia bacterium]
MLLPLLHQASGPYDFHWSLHADVVLLCIFVEAIYLYIVTQLRDVLSDAGRVRRRQAILFTAGVLSVYAVAGTPVHDLSEQYLLSFHMFQHAVFMLVSAPLLLAGIPAWVWQALFRTVPGTFRVAKVLVHPIVAFALFNAVVLVTHFPFAVDYALNHHWFHFWVHAALLVSAMMMWWPVLSDVPELPRMSAPLQMGYLFLQSIVPAVMASFITFSDSVVYPFYEKAPRTWGISALEDQQMGGGLMKLFGSVVLWSFITVVFFQWWNREERETREPTWHEVDTELELMGLNRRR